jgi:hypothetical protein
MILILIPFFVVVVHRIRRFGCTIGMGRGSRKLEYWKLTGAS